MYKKFFLHMAAFWIIVSLAACGSSQAQIDALSTQIAGEIYGTVTASALQTASAASTDTPSITPTHTAAEVSPTNELVMESQPVDPILGLPQGTDGCPWWNDSVFYEIFVRSFYDSDGDGIGDLNGITQKLNYLNDGDPETTTDLGITGIWLMPIFPSPSYHGYDVTNYYDINPEYGTMDDFRNLISEAHARGIRVIIDLVINHTSNQHPWFIQAASSSSQYHDWYIWSSTDPGYSGSWGQQVWFPSQGGYYYSTFTAGMPDLNYTNPDVTAQMQDVVLFWLEDVGVDGFRLDAAKHIIEEGTIQANSDSTHAWWKDFHSFYKQINPEILIVGEVWEDTAITAEYLQGDEFDLSFEFWLAGAMINAVNGETSQDIDDQMELSYSLIPQMQYATFLTNHDQDRVMSQLFDDENKMKLAASLLLTSPGVPFIYYGEEIGMQGDQAHEWVRRPMQWSDGTFAGFSTKAPWQALGPAWENYNVDLEKENSDSILSFYRDLIYIRNQHAALRVGDLKILTTTDDAVYSFLRVSDNEAVLVLINLSGQPVDEVWLTKSESSLSEGIYQPVPILGEGDFEPIEVNEQGGLFHMVDTPQIPPYGVFILQLHEVLP
jgi:alpha-amylase